RFFVTHLFIVQHLYLDTNFCLFFSQTKRPFLVFFFKKRSNATSPIIFHITDFPFQKWVQLSTEHTKYCIPRWCFIMHPVPILHRTGCPLQFKRLIANHLFFVIPFRKEIGNATSHHTSSNNNDIITSLHHCHHPFPEQILQIWKQLMNHHLRRLTRLYASVLKASSCAERLIGTLEYQSVHE